MNILWFLLSPQIPFYIGVTGLSATHLAILGSFFTFSLMAANLVSSSFTDIPMRVNKSSIILYSAKSAHDSPLAEKKLLSVNASSMLFLVR